MCVIDQEVALIPFGYCWFCNEPLPPGQEFCHNNIGADRGCRGDYFAKEAKELEESQNE